MNITELVTLYDHNCHNTGTGSFHNIIRVRYTELRKRHIDEIRKMQLYKSNERFPIQRDDCKPEKAKKLYIRNWINHGSFLAYTHV